MKTSIGLCGATGKTPELQIGQVKTVDYTQKASVEITGTRENPILNFNIPKGKDGAKLIVKEYFNGDITIINSISELHEETSDAYGKNVLSENAMIEFINNNKTELNSRIEKENKIEKIKKYRYLLSTFKAHNDSDQNSRLELLLSNDGVKWDKLQINAPNLTIRDPFIYQKDGVYYVFATNLITDTEFKYFKTTNLIDYEVISYPYTGLNNYVDKWAPSIFEDNNDLYMTISLSDDGSVPHLRQYYSKLDENFLPISWKEFKIKNTLNIYDGHIFKDNGKYFLYYKKSDDNKKGVEISVCDTIDGTFTPLGIIETDDLKEAPFITSINGVPRLYLDTYEGDGGVTYKDMQYDLGYNKPIITKGKYKHCHVLDLTGKNPYNGFTNKLSFIELTDLNDTIIPNYQNRSFSPNTLNTPDKLQRDDNYGKVTLYSTGGNHFMQELKTLNNKTFKRCYVNGWSNWVEELSDFNYYTKTHIPSMLIGGYTKIEVVYSGNKKIVNINGYFNDVDTSKGSVQKGFDIPSDLRPSSNFTIITVNAQNWDDKTPFVEFKGTECNLLLQVGSVTKKGDYISFNTTYII